MSAGVIAVYLFVKCGEQFKPQATPDVMAANPKI
jgi:hypothetical protein